MHELANENRFRKDLIYRINTVEINMPPLRRRNEDITILARHFAKLYASKYLKPSVDFDAAALQKLKSYNYPGNVRELQYTIERAVIMADDHILRPDDLIFSILETATDTVVDDDNIQLSTLEKNAILRVIEKHNGNITRAAKELGLTRTALYRRLSKYDI
jgi:DNA-binding NtrC family response regulator